MALGVMDFRIAEIHWKILPENLSNVLQVFLVLYLRYCLSNLFFTTKKDKLELPENYLGSYFWDSLQEVDKNYMCFVYSKTSLNHVHKNTLGLFWELNLATVVTALGDYQIFNLRFIQLIHQRILYGFFFKVFS